MATKPKTAAERTAEACERIALATERTAIAAERAAAAAEKAAAATLNIPPASKSQRHLVLDTSALTTQETAQLKQFQKEFKKRILHLGNATKLTPNT